MTASLRSFRKGPDESTSLTGQLLHDREPHIFDVIDVDGSIYKATRKCHRYFEDKLPGERISAAQMRVLPLIATSLQIQVMFGHVNEGGVYIVWYPGDTVASIDERARIRVQRVVPTWRFETEELGIGPYSHWRSLLMGERWP